MGEKQEKLKLIHEVIRDQNVIMVSQLKLLMFFESDQTPDVMISFLKELESMTNRMRTPKQNETPAGTTGKERHL